MRTFVSRHRGFTLIELLVVVAIVAVLVALMVPAVQQAREAARRTQCKSHLRQLALGLHNYHETHSILPSGQYFCKAGTDCSDRPFYAPGWGWTASLLPYVEQSALYNGLNFSLPMLDAAHVNLLAVPLPVFTCPSDATRKEWVRPSGLWYRPERLATSNYCGNGGSFGFSFETPVLARNERQTNGVLGRDSARRFRDITDGLSNTILLGEVIHHDFPWDPTLYGHWDPPSKTACCTLALVRVGITSMNPGSTGTVDEKRQSFSSLHPGGAHFAFCDGSVRFLSELIDTSSRQLTAETSGDPYDQANNGADYRVWQRLLSRNDGFAVDDF